MVGGMRFADDFVGVSDSNKNLQKLIEMLYIVTGVNGEYELTGVRV